jgi:LacI family transcriptional regulator
VDKLTIKEVAREAGVSTATISRVLNNTGYVSSEARQRVLDTVDRLNYRPNAVARSLKQEKTKGIGFIIPDMTNPYFMTVSRALQHKLVPLGFHSLLFDTEGCIEKEKSALQFFHEMRVSVVVLVSSGVEASFLNTYTGSGMRFILADRLVDGFPADFSSDSNKEAAKLGMAHLLKNTPAKIAVIHGPPSLSTSAQRREGVMEALQEYGYSDDRLVQVEGDYTRQSGYDAAIALMGEAVRPDAVFSANNEMTYALDGVEVVSFGELEFASLFEHRMTTIVQKPEEVGHALAELALRRMEAMDAPPETRLFMPTLQSY